MLEEQRVVEAEPRGEHQRDQMEQVQRHAARMQDREMSSVVSAIGASTRNTRERLRSANATTATSSTAAIAEAPQNALALLRDQLFGRVLEIEQRTWRRHRPRSARKRRDVVHAAQRHERRAPPSRCSSSMSTRDAERRGARASRPSAAAARVLPSTSCKNGSNTPARNGVPVCARCSGSRAASRARAARLARRCCAAALGT